MNEILALVREKEERTLSTEGWSSRIYLLISDKRRRIRTSMFLRDKSEKTSYVNTTRHQDCSVRTRKSSQVKGPLTDLDHPSERSNVLPVTQAGCK